MCVESWPRDHQGTKGTREQALGSPVEVLGCSAQSLCTAPEGLTSGVGAAPFHSWHMQGLAEARPAGTRAHLQTLVWAPVGPGLGWPCAWLSMAGGRPELNGEPEPGRSHGRCLPTGAASAGVKITESRGCWGGQRWGPGTRPREGPPCHSFGGYHSVSGI